MIAIYWRPQHNTLLKDHYIRLGKGSAGGEFETKSTIFWLSVAHTREVPLNLATNNPLRWTYLKRVAAFCIKQSQVTERFLRFCKEPIVIDNAVSLKLTRSILFLVLDNFELRTAKSLLEWRHKQMCSVVLKYYNSFIALISLPLLLFLSKLINFGKKRKKKTEKKQSNKFIIVDVSVRTTYKFKLLLSITVSH